MSVIDANENDHTSRRYTVAFFCFRDEICDDMPLLSDINASFIIYHKFLVRNSKVQQTSNVFLN